ncbi:HlyD family type I secretion periplasmic adaptor subunit [Thalassospira lucentensis]|uniref:HlyD family type I secretion periplasmic adaptor subunit n=1 Tax=Thalassospira lucentensis TaxID=168935 RepID=UPI003D2A0D04
MSHKIADYEKFIKEHVADRKSFRGNLLLFVVILFLAVALIWAALTEIDEVTRGQGKVIPSRQVQEIQSFESGIIQQILVRKGEIVEEGQVLLVLDRTQIQSSYDQARQKQLSLSAEIARLSAEMNGSALVFPQAIEQDAPSLVVAQRQLYEGRRAELASELEVLDNQFVQRQKELGEARSELATLRQGIAYSRSEIDLIAPLVERGIESQVSFLQLQRSLSELEGKYSTTELRIERLQVAIDEVSEKRKAAVDRYRSEAFARISEATSELAELEKSMPAYQDKITRAEVRSPVYGVVNRVMATTIGGVANSGEPLVEVVPIDDTLLVEANIAPADIAFLHPGQRVKVKLTAYDFARYGSLDGRLVTIGADAIEDPKTEETFYPVQIEVESALYDAAGKALDIVPGMVADIDVLTGKRTILEYITEPVVKVKETAFREN